MLYKNIMVIYSWYVYIYGNVWKSFNKMENVENVIV